MGSGWDSARQLSVILGRSIAMMHVMRVYHKDLTPRNEVGEGRGAAADAVF
jgi:tRNA A-37 threonylcarbamoyl transferase component Bud32